MAITIDSVERVTIKPLEVPSFTCTVEGTAPYVQHKFSTEKKDELAETHKAGSKSKKGKARKARDFTSDFEGAQHVSEQGWVGIPATAFRSAMIDACRIAGFKMTWAKQSIFVEADGHDAADATPLVRIIGPYEQFVVPVRNATGVIDLRSRPKWPVGWTASVTLRYDADVFTASDVVNLLARAGVQVGIGEGRPASKKSAGMGWGTFKVLSQEGDNHG